MRPWRVCRAFGPRFGAMKDGRVEDVGGGSALSCASIECISREEGREERSRKWMPWLKGRKRRDGICCSLSKRFMV